MWFIDGHAQAIRTNYIQNKADKQQLFSRYYIFHCLSLPIFHFYVVRNMNITAPVWKWLSGLPAFVMLTVSTSTRFHARHPSCVHLHQKPMDDMLYILGVIQTTGPAVNNLTCLLWAISYNKWPPEVHILYYLSVLNMDQAVWPMNTTTFPWTVQALLLQVSGLFHALVNISV